MPVANASALTPAASKPGSTVAVPSSGWLPSEPPPSYEISRPSEPHDPIDRSVHVLETVTPLPTPVPDTATVAALIFLIAPEPTVNPGGALRVNLSSIFTQTAALPPVATASYCLSASRPDKGSAAMAMGSPNKALVSFSAVHMAGASGNTKSPASRLD